MKNKDTINRIKNAAELAWAAYGYFDLIGKKFAHKKEYGNRTNTKITLHDILDSTYVNYETHDSTFTNTLKLKGDMTPTQVKNFFEKYELLDYYPKFDTKNNRQKEGFRTCLFQDKESKEYTLAIRGSFDSADYTTDFVNLLKDSTIPFDYLHAMILFYESCAKKYPEITKPKSLNIVGHSLGGCLAQIFALCFAKNPDVLATEFNQDSIINEVYTFNAPGAKNLKPHIVLDSKQIYEVDESIIKASNPAQAMFAKITKGDPNANTEWWETLANTLTQQQNISLALQIYFSKIPSNELKSHKIFLHSYIVNSMTANVILYQAYPISDTFLQAYQTLTHNYNNRNKESYKLSVSDRVYHIETDNDNNTENNQWQDELIQNLGKDIEGKHYYLNIGIDIKGMDSHSIKSSVIILYFYEYLLDLETNREKLSNRIKELESNPKYPTTLNHIGYKAAKNKGKYQLITALLNDFMQWNYNSLREVNEVVLSEVKNKYKEQKKNDKNTSNPPKKIFPLVYLLNEVSYIARFKNSKDIEEFNIYKMIDLITQLQEAKIYIRILDKKFFDELENKQCSVAELRSVLKCQPFMVVDENNKEILNESNRAEIFYYKTFNNLVSQILQSYKTA